MRKIKLFAILAALLVGSFALTSCVQDYPNDTLAQIDLTDYRLKGDMNGWGETNILSKVGNTTYTTEFVATGTSANFKIATADWSKEWASGAEQTVGETKEFPGSGGNSTIKGLEVGSTYVCTCEAGALSITVTFTKK